MQYVQTFHTVKGPVCHKKCFQKSAMQIREDGETLDTVTLFSVPGRNPSLAVSRSSRIGLSCVTHWVRSALCSSGGAGKVLPSSALPGAGRAAEAREQRADLKTTTAQFVERDLTELQSTSRPILRTQMQNLSFQRGKYFIILFKLYERENVSFIC